MLSFHGLLVVDKPSGPTSLDVVNRAQKWFPRKTKLGHTGTLDPLASGVLVLCVGMATRLTEYVQQMEKGYVAELLMGARSTTDDALGKITAVADPFVPSPAVLRQTLAQFVGDIEQVPPIFSAAKISGDRAYDLARRGEEVELQPRTVRIYEIQILDYSFPALRLEIRCGKGTYIRSLARDLGDRLGCGALVQTLRRTRIGAFEEKVALSLDCEKSVAQAALLPPNKAVAELPSLNLSAETCKRLRQGQAVSILASPSFTAESKHPEVAVFDPAGTLVAVARLDHKKALLNPIKVLVQ